MSASSSRIRRDLLTASVYLALVASVFSFNIIRSRTTTPAAVAITTESETPKVVSDKPYFLLTTHKTYSPNESTRLWASYRNIDYLDFRVYRVKDPNKFFKQLDDPHEMGEKEKEQIAQGYGSRVSLLERTHRFKLSLFGWVKDYVRTHLIKDHRVAF